MYYILISLIHIVCTKCIYILNTQTANNVMVKKSYLLPKKKYKKRRFKIHVQPFVL